MDESEELKREIMQLCQDLTKFPEIYNYSYLASLCMKNM